MKKLEYLEVLGQNISFILSFIYLFTYLFIDIINVRKWRTYRKYRDKGYTCKGGNRLKLFLPPISIEASLKGKIKFFPLQ